MSSEHRHAEDLQRSNQYEVLPAKVSVPRAQESVAAAARREFVAAKITPPDARKPCSPKTAVFVTHGMGQQIPFQTLDQVAEGLRKQDPRWNSTALPKPQARVVKSGDETLTRIELQLQDDAGAPHEVHVYEGYWAPLTEGRVTLKDVIGFLFTAGINGVYNGSLGFKRWLFGDYVPFGAQIRTVMYLLIALATVAALIAMNSMIVLVLAAKSPVATAPAWLSEALFVDLTTTFNMLITVLAVLALSLLTSLQARSFRFPAQFRWMLAYPTFALLFVALAATILAGLSMPILLYGHITISPHSVQFWSAILGADLVNQFNYGFACVFCSVLAFAAVTALLAGASRLAVGVWNSDQYRFRTIVIVSCLVGIVVLAILQLWSFWLVVKANSSPDFTLPTVVERISWPLLMGVSLFVRGKLVQYLGDVAAYVTPHTLDRFNELRTRIKSCVSRSAHAIYSLKEDDGQTYEYERVIIVGHSLGSVIVYDVLNGLINEDALTGQDGQDVVRRTPLLVTFGSPLDKTAFLFAMQAQHTTEAREALAAAVQPLIQSYTFRPQRWLNLWSPADIVSGYLQYYDPRQSNDPKMVTNIIDNDAATVLMAHLEYWDNPLLFQLIYEEVTHRGRT